MRTVFAMGISTILLAAGLPVVSGASPAEAAPLHGKGRTVTIPLTGSDGTPTPAAVAGLEPAAERASKHARGRAPRGTEALRTEPLAAEEFVVAGLTWDDEDALPADALIQVRAHEQGGWSDWLDLSVEEGGPDGTETGGTVPFITGGATGIEVRVNGERLPGGLELTLIPEDADGSAVTVTDPEAATVLPQDEGVTKDESVPEESGLPPAGGGGGVGTNSRVVVPVSVPASVPVDGVGNIISRGEWGADEAYTTSHWTQKYAPLRAAVVHHTAGTNTYTAAQSAGIVRAIFTYHAVTREWGDIGYNFLVDKYGQIFEGRQGSLQAASGAPKGWLVEGGHSRGYNRGSLGISAMGDFTLTSAPDSTKIISAMAKVVAWKFREANLDAGALSGFFAPTTRTYTTYAAGQQLPRIFGHGDVASTSCPGGVYGRLGEMRTLVRNAYKRLSDTSPPVIRATVGSDGLVRLSAWDAESGVEGIYYTLDGSQMYWSPAYVANPSILNTRYTGPFRSSSIETLAVVAVDASGNSSDPLSPELQPFVCERPPNDLDGDCSNDLVTRTPDGRLWLHSGADRSAGSWSAPQQIGWGWGVMNLLESVGDVDGNSHADLIARDVTGDLWLYPGPGFYGSERVRIGWNWNVMSALTGVDDGNGDSIPDLVARDMRGDLWLYAGPNFYGSERIKIGWNWNVMSTLTGVGDLNGDGQSDLVALESGTGDLWLYRGGGFSGTTRVLIGRGWDVMDAIVGVGDFDGDANSDLVARERSTGYLWLYPGDGAGGLGPREKLPNPDGMSWSWRDVNAFT